MDNSEKLQLIISKLKNVTPYKRIGLLEYGALQELIKTTEGLLQIVEERQQTPARNWRDHLLARRDDLLARSERNMAELMGPPSQAEQFFRTARKECRDAQQVEGAAYQLKQAELSKQSTEQLLRETEALRRNRR